VRRSHGLLLAAFALWACQTRLGAPEPVAEASDATRKELAREAVGAYVEQIQRVLALALRLRVAGAGLCGDAVAPILGLHLEQRLPGGGARAYVEALSESLGVDDRVTVVAVAPDSPADRAGVRAGDRVLRVDGKEAKRVRHVFEALRGEPERPPVLALERDGAGLEVTLERVIGCDAEIWLAYSDEITTGRVSGAAQGFVTTGFVRFAADDDELAAAIAHEIAHRAIGGLPGTYPEAELRADALSLEILRRAGRDPAAALRLWERFAVEKPWMIVFEPRSNFLNEPPHGRLAERLLEMPRLLEPSDRAPDLARSRPESR